MSNKALIVEGRCVPSPSLPSLFDTEPYVVRINIIEKIQDCDICGISSVQASPVVVEVLEVFKDESKYNNEAITMPGVGDKFVMFYLTDTGYSEWIPTIDLGTEEDRGYVVLPTPMEPSDCFVDNEQRSVLVINQCYWNGNQPWSKIAASDRNNLRSDDSYVELNEKVKTKEASTVEASIDPENEREHNVFPISATLESVVASFLNFKNIQEGDEKEDGVGGEKKEVDKIQQEQEEKNSNIFLSIFNQAVAWVCSNLNVGAWCLLR